MTEDYLRTLSQEDLIKLVLSLNEQVSNVSYQATELAKANQEGTRQIMRQAENICVLSQRLLFAGLNHTIHNDEKQKIGEQHGVVGTPAIEGATTKEA